jgi:hypothetical protein
MIPAPFRSLRVLRVLNAPAVGLALAAVTSAAFAGVLEDSVLFAMGTGFPTLVLGMVWVLLLRWPKTVGRTTFRWGWLASVPLAALNAALACGSMMAFEATRNAAPFVERFFWGALIGGTFGVICWLPALVVTLLCFGLPIASAHRDAEKGLAGEERGERTVGLACAAMSLAAIAVAAAVHPSHASGLWVSRTLAAMGLVTGGAAAILAAAREARRKRFVAEAGAGKIPGYRVDDTDEGQVLVRVVSHGAGYRVADFEEEVYELDAAGEATRPRVLEPPRA